MLNGLFQVQCNVFQGADGEVALTAGGGKRKIIGLASTSENVALVCQTEFDFSFLYNGISCTL